MKLFEAFQSALQLIPVSPESSVVQCPCLAVFEAQNPGALKQSIKKPEPRIIAPWEAAAPEPPESLLTDVKLYRFSIIHGPLGFIVSGACGLCPECGSLYYYHDEEAAIAPVVPPEPESCKPGKDCCDLALVKGIASICECLCHKAE